MSAQGGCEWLKVGVYATYKLAPPLAALAGLVWVLAR